MDHAYQAHCLARITGTKGALMWVVERVERKKHVISASLHRWEEVTGQFRLIKVTETKLAKQRKCMSSLSV